MTTTGQRCVQFVVYLLRVVKLRKQMKATDNKSKFQTEKLNKRTSCFFFHFAYSFNIHLPTTSKKKQSSLTFFFSQVILDKNKVDFWLTKIRTGIFLEIQNPIQEMSFKTFNFFSESSKGNKWNSRTKNLPNRFTVPLLGTN